MPKPTMWRQMMLAAAALLGAPWLGVAPAAARTLPVVKPVLACAGLAETDVPLAAETPARIVSARVFTGGTAPYCEVRGYVAPQVKFELRLPIETWRQRLMFSGCGGFCGQVALRVRAAEGCAAVDNGQFALVTSDLGHDTPDGNGDTVWAAGNRQTKIDYGYRGVHVVTLAAKAIVERFYGQPQTFAYFNGCSDGGREALMEVQRYPLDFNGVIAGASVIHDTLNNSVGHAWAIQHLTRAGGAPMFTPADLATLHAGALAACGSGGLIVDPSLCRFDPATIVCAAGAAAKCLTAEQAAAAKAIYGGPRNPDGGFVYYGRPIGSELDWYAGNTKALVDGFVRYMAADTSQPVNVMSMTFDRAAVARYMLLASIYDAVDPDIRKFQKAGGKLIMWHGWADPGVPPTSSVDYYRDVRHTLGTDAANHMIRLYMLPGVSHCGNGEGPDRINLVDAITGWVEDGTPPGPVVATKSVSGAITAARTIRPYDPAGTMRSDRTIQ